MKARACWAFAALLTGGVACGGGQVGQGIFTAKWDEDGGKAIGAVADSVGRTPIPLGADVAVGVTEHSSKLVGVPLAGGARWTFAHALDARPVIAGGVVVGSGAGELFALDALTGRLLWRTPTVGLTLRGAGDDGAMTVVTMTLALGRGSSLLAISRDGEVRQRLETAESLGSPAVVSHLAFVPWANQYVTALDLSSGSERGRALLREKTTRAWTSGGGLYFGELGMFRFDAKIKDASSGRADHLSLPPRVFPGHPLFARPGDETVPPGAGAADKIRLYARPTPPAEALALDSQRFYATYFRLAFGLAAGSARLAWVHTHPVAFIGGAAAPGSLVLCDVSGKVTTLDAAHGGVIGDVVDLGSPLESCIVQADGFQKPGSAQNPGSLVQQIRVALSERDSELDAGQGVLLRELGTIPEEGATELLLEVAMDSRTSPVVVDEVRAVLASRRTGARFLVAALEKHYDFVHDFLVPPPVGALARALAEMNEKSAAPALASHLFDPVDSDKDVLDAAQALTVLAGPAEVPSLLRFFALYRDAPPEPEEIPVAVNAVGEALLRVGGKEGQAAIDLAIHDAATNPVVRAKLLALLEAAKLQRETPSTPSTTPSSTSRE